MGAEEEKTEGCWSRFKAGCLVLHIFILSTIETTTRMLNTLTREHRRIRRTIDLEKRKVKQKALAIVRRNAGETRWALTAPLLLPLLGCLHGFFTRNV